LLIKKEEDRVGKIQNITKQKEKFPKELKLYKVLIWEINELRRGFEGQSSEELQGLSADLKERIREGEPVDELLVEAFALACEASRRVLGLRVFDVQLAGAIALHQGELVQMQTGEGKTLTAVLPAFLNGLNGRGVHILTFNDYLAGRDAGWMGPVFDFLGLSVGNIQEGMSIQERQEAYHMDITYLTAREAGFDFLRDNRCLSREDLVQREFSFAIVDEADSILVDEARVPLVIAGDMPVNREDPYQLASLIRSLDREKDYYFDEYSRDVNYTDDGLSQLENQLKLGNDDLHLPRHNQLLAALNLALQAECLLHRDVEYIIREGKVELVDEFTGRVADKRRWPYGLQTAIEAREGLEVQPEGMILGSITLQHFVKLYPKLAGMTATAVTSETEFFTFYQLEVRVIPSNRSCIRIDEPDVVFSHKEAKAQALIHEISQSHKTGRPILVGTGSVGESESLAEALRLQGISCNVLNAKNDEKEAAIVADAGALNAVTISTNMAGRGTDIRLGGKNELTRDEVLAQGGLYVIGTNLHESRRIDDQLRGRAARQGDPGSTCFFISLEDPLMERYGLKKLVPPKLWPLKQEKPLHNLIILREVARAQRIVENQNLEIRKTLFKYSTMVEEQRKILFQWRRNILLNFKIESLGLLEDVESQRYQDLIPKVGIEVLKKVEKELTLFYIDYFWTDHLAYISHIREGIHLVGYGGRDPLCEFQKLIIKAFKELQQKIDDSVLESFRNASITKDGIDKANEGLTGPSSTWTYLINDNSFQNQLVTALVGSTAFSIGAAFFVIQFHLFYIVGRVFLGIFRKIRKFFENQGRCRKIDEKHF
jgi:preprotein translocase subunit SecA